MTLTLLFCAHTLSQINDPTLLHLHVANKGEK